MSVSFRQENDIGYVEFDQTDSKVNLLTADVLKALDRILDDITRRTDLNTVVFMSKKDNVFIAGADIKEIEGITEAEDGQRKSQAGQNIMNKIEDLEVPTVAVIDGVALGGGCELAAACDYRLATFNEKVKIGLPEVGLGFIPGFGGTYRLPRLVGLEQGMKLILSGKPVDGTKALKIGLVDRLAPRQGLAASVQQFIADIHGGKLQSDKYVRHQPKKFLARLLSGSLIVQFIILHQSKKSVLKMTKGFYPAYLKAINVVSETFYCGRDEGMALEAKAFSELAVTDVSKNCVKVFYLTEKYKKLSLTDADHIKPAAIGKAGLCGAGIMGGGIAQLLSFKGIWVRLKDVNYGALAQGYKAASGLYQQLVKKRKMSQAQADKSMARITGTLDYSGFANADIVIEAVVEKMEVKKAVFKELSRIVSAQTILATNTSALSVTELAKETKDPSKVIGFHFFNPVHRMPLVEVITTPMTSKETIVTTLQFAKRLGKTPVLVKDACGFLVNRILLGYINEAGRILEECGQMERVDKLATSFGLPMGPFALSDEVGLDVGVKVLRILEEGLGRRYKPVGTFERILDKGLLGKKSGKGFYVHKGWPEPNETVNSMLQAHMSTQFPREDYLKRMIYIMINEASLCLSEGIVREASDVDIGMIFGTGFPAFRGGLLRYADHVGIDAVVRDLERFAGDLDAQRFCPSPLLLDLCRQRKGFYSD